MALQYINTGSSSNKGDGDTLRTAFRKINDNFRELYDFGVPDIASATTAGIIKVGVGLSISGAGVLSATGEATSSTITLLDNAGSPSIDIVSYSGSVTMPPNNTTSVALFSFNKTVYKSASIDWFAEDQTNNTIDLGSGYLVTWQGNSAAVFGGGLVAMDNDGNTNNATWDITSATVTSTAVTLYAYNVSNTNTSHTVDWRAKVSLVRL